MSGERISFPFTTAQILGADATAPGDDQRVLIVAQKIGGTATSGELISGVQSDESVWNALFGARSQAAAAIRRFRKVNKQTNLDVIALDDNGAGVKAAAQINFGGTATTAGTVTVIIGSETEHKVSIPVTVGLGGVQIATATVNAINANLTLPAVATLDGVVAGRVDLEAANAGTVGNETSIRVSTDVAGITAVPVAFTGGAGDPSLTGLFDVVDDFTRYRGVVWPGVYGFTEITAFLDARFNAAGVLLDGVAFSAIVDTLANAKATLDTENSQSLVVFVNRLVAGNTQIKGGAIAEQSIAIASEVAAIRALRLEPGAAIGSFVSAGALDAIGGPRSSSLPYANTRLPFMPLVGLGLGFTRDEVVDLNDSGGSVVGNNKARNGSIMGELLTTYKTDSAGNADESFRFLNYVDTLTSIREYIFNQVTSEYRQTRLDSAGAPSIPGVAKVTVDDIKAFIVGLYGDLRSADFALTQGSEEALQFLKQNLLITANLQTGNVNIAMVLPIVTQLRSINIPISFTFTVGA